MWRNKLKSFHNSFVKVHARKPEKLILQKYLFDISESFQVHRVFMLLVSFIDY